MKNNKENKVKSDCVVNKKKTFKKTGEDEYYICYCSEKPIHICKPCYEDCHSKFCKELFKEEKNNEVDLKNFETSLRTKCKLDTKPFDNYCECQTEKCHDFNETHSTKFENFKKKDNKKTIFSTIIPYEAQLTEYIKYEYIDLDEDGEEYYNKDKDKKENEVDIRKNVHENLFEKHFISMLAASYLKNLSFEEILNNKSLIILLAKTMKSNIHYFFNNIEELNNVKKIQENIITDLKDLKNYDKDKGKELNRKIEEIESELGNKLFILRKLYLNPVLMKKNKILTTMFGYDENISFLQRRLFFQNSCDYMEDQVYKLIVLIKDFLEMSFKKNKSEVKQEKSNSKNLVLIVKEFCKYVEIYMNYELSDENSNEKKNKEFNKNNLSTLLSALMNIKSERKLDKDFYRLDEAIFMIQIKLIDLDISKNKLNNKKALNNTDNDLISRENLAKNLGKNKKFLELSKYEKVFYKLKYFEEFYTHPLKHFKFPDHINMQINKGDDDEELKIDNYIQDISNVCRWNFDKCENSGENTECLLNNIDSLMKKIKTSFSPKNIIEMICKHIKDIQTALEGKNDVEKKHIQHQFFAKGYTSKILGQYQFVTSNRFLVKIFEESKDFNFNDEGELYNTFNFFISVNLKLLFMLIENNEVLIPLFFNTKTLNIIFSQKSELSEEEILEKREKIKSKEIEINKLEEKLNSDKDNDKDETFISDDAKKKEKQQIDLEVYKRQESDNRKDDMIEENDTKPKKNEEKKNKEEIKKKIEKLKVIKTPPPDIYNALDFNNIITFYGEILQHLKQHEIQIDLAPLLKKLKHVSKINTEVSY